MIVFQRAMITLAIFTLCMLMAGMSDFVINALVHIHYKVTARKRARYEKYGLVYKSRLEIFLDGIVK